MSGRGKDRGREGGGEIALLHGKCETGGKAHFPVLHFWSGIFLSCIFQPWKCAISFSSHIWSLIFPVRHFQSTRLAPWLTTLSAGQWSVHCHLFKLLLCWGHWSRYTNITWYQRWNLVQTLPASRKAASRRYSWGTLVACYNAVSRSSCGRRRSAQTSLRGTTACRTCSTVVCRSRPSLVRRTGSRPACTVYTSSLFPENVR